MRLRQVAKRHNLYGCEVLRFGKGYGLRFCILSVYRPGKVRQCGYVYSVQNCLLNEPVLCDL